MAQGIAKNATIANASTSLIGIVIMLKKVSFIFYMIKTLGSFTIR
jgi:hypothetical protein